MSTASTAAADFAVWARANRVAWVTGGWIAALAIVAVLQRPDVTFTAARATYLLLAVYGLQLLARDTSQPSLGHAAFLALGAYGTAFLRLRGGLDGLTAALVLTSIGTLLGLILGLGVTHLRPAFLALLTWTLGWAVYVGLGAIPDLSGGIAGISIREPMRVRWEPLGVDLTFSDAGHLALGTALLALLLLLYRSAQTSVIGRGWAALRDSRALATSLGYDVAATRRYTFAVAAAVATLAGALGADLVGVVDPTSYSPLQSLNLLAAVLIGVPLGFFGPLAGALVTSGAPYLVDQLSAITGVPVGTGRELASAALTLAAVTLSFRFGLRRPTRPTVPTGPRRESADAPDGGAASGPVQVTPASLEATGIHVEFDGVRALDGVSLAVRPATIHGLVGPNGSGKSTLLRCLAGSIPYSGKVRLGDLPLEGLAEYRRVRCGVTRTFQRTATMPHLTAREHVEAGLHVRQRSSGWAQALFRTPRYRREARDGRGQAYAALAAFGLGDRADTRPDALSGGHQRLLQIATAAATGPRALLLDEPSAGMDAAELEMLESGIRTVVAGGMAVLLIEHNFGFLARVAERVTVLDAGVVIAEGTPAQIAADPDVRRAYLGVSSAPIPEPPRRAPRRRRPPPGA